jgi:hypothetical protein
MSGPGTKEIQQQFFLYAITSESAISFFYGRGQVHDESMAFLKAWMAEYTAAVYPVNLTEVCVSRKCSAKFGTWIYSLQLPVSYQPLSNLSKPPLEEVPTCPAMFPMHAFSPDKTSRGNIYILAQLCPLSVLGTCRVVVYSTPA